MPMALVYIKTMYNLSQVNDRFMERRYISYFILPLHHIQRKYDDLFSILTTNLDVKFEKKLLKVKEFVSYIYI